MSTYSYNTDLDEWSNFTKLLAKVITIPVSNAVVAVTGVEVIPETTVSTPNGDIKVNTLAMLVGLETRLTRGAKGVRYRRIKLSDYDNLDFTGSLESPVVLSPIDPNSTEPKRTLDTFRAYLARRCNIPLDYLKARVVDTTGIISKIELWLDLSTASMTKANESLCFIADTTLNCYTSVANVEVMDTLVATPYLDGYSSLTDYIPDLVDSGYLVGYNLHYEFIEDLVASEDKAYLLGYRLNEVDDQLGEYLADRVDKFYLDGYRNLKDVYDNIPEV